MTEEPMVYVTDNGVEVAARCHQKPMLASGTNTTWDGKPGEGHEIHTIRFRCQNKECSTAVASTIVREC